MGPISADEKRWREEDDARTLAEAERIKQDPGRLAGAKTAAKRMVDEEKERLSAMSKVAGKAPSAPASKAASSDTKSAVVSGEKSSGSHNVFNRI